MDKKQLENLTTLSELAIELKMNKSKLNYYAYLDVIKPIKRLYRGKVGLYNRKEVIAMVKRIRISALMGITIKELAESMRKK